MRTASSYTLLVGTPRKIPSAGRAATKGTVDMNRRKQRQQRITQSVLSDSSIQRRLRCAPLSSQVFRMIRYKFGARRKYRAANT